MVYHGGVYDDLAWVNTTVVYRTVSRSDPQMSLRLPGNLKPRLVEVARANGRTINAEIVARLERSFAVDGGDALPSDLKTAILETRDKVATLFDAVKVPPARPPGYPPKKK